MKNIILTTKTWVMILGMTIALPGFAKKGDIPVINNDTSAYEEFVQFENWMTTESYLESESIDLESWMNDPAYLNKEETPLTMEKWMTKADYLNPKPLAMEKWMTDKAYLK